MARPRISYLGAHTFAARLTIYASGFASSVLIARALGPEGRGLYLLPVTIVTIAAMVGSLGVEPAQVRLWAHRRASRDQFETAAAVLAAALGTAAAALAWGFYELGRPTLFKEVEPIDVAIVVALLPIWIHSNLVRSLLVLSGRLTTANVALVIGDLVRSCGIVLLYLTVGLDVEVVLLMFGVLIVTPWILMTVSPARTGRIRRPVPWPLIGSELRLGIQIAPYAVFLFLNLRLDIFLLAGRFGPADVGIYSIAVLLSELVWLATDSLAASIKERQANAPPREAMDVTASAVRMNLVIAIGGGLLLALIAPVMIDVLYGNGFSSAAPVVWALAPAAAAMAVWRTVAVALVRFEKPWLPPLVGLIAISVNLVANLLLIPSLGMIGAGLASVASYGCGAALSCALLIRNAGLPARGLLPGMAELRRLLEALRPSAIRRVLGLALSDLRASRTGS